MSAPRTNNQQASSSQRSSSQNSSVQAPNGVLRQQQQQVVRSGNNGEQQTVCPRCRSTLLVPPGAASFRCPCGAVFRQQPPAGARAAVPGSTGAPTHVHQQGRTLALVCGSCHNLALLPPGASSGLFMCACGAPLLVPPNAGTPLRVSQNGGILLPSGAAAALAGLGARSTGVSPLLLSQLPTFPYKTDGNPPKTAENEDGDEFSCRVCLGEYEEGEELRLLPCFHRFHKDCVDEWLARNKLCPLCNGAVDAMMSEQQSVFTGADGGS